MDAVFLLGAACNLGPILKDTTDRVDQMLLRTQSNLDLQVAGMTRDLKLLETDLRSTTSDNMDRLGELMRRVDGLGQNIVLLAGEEVQCTASSVNIYVREGLEDLRAWWKGRPLPKRDPFFCHVAPAYIAIDEVSKMAAPLLFGRGMRMTDERISFQLLTAKGAEVLMGDAQKYLARMGNSTIELNLRDLVNDKLLTCEIRKVRYGWYAKPGNFHVMGEVFAGCMPPGPKCPGGSEMIDGLCSRCSFRLADFPGASITHTSAPGNGGLGHKDVLSFQCPMKANSRIRVSVGGDVSVLTQYESQFGAWPRWIEMNLNASGLFVADCATGVRGSYTLEIQGNHKVAMCGEWSVPVNNALRGIVAFERCKQGDAATTCRLENNWQVDFEAQ